MPAKKSKKTKSLNLLPQNKFEQSLFGRTLKWTLSTFRVIVIFVELVVIVGFLGRFYLDIEHSDLNDTLEEKQAVISSYSQFEKEFKHTQASLKLWESWKAPQDYFSTLLDKVIARLPDGIQLTSLSKKEGQIEIQLATLSEQPVAQFISNLKTDPELANISIISIESDNNSSVLLLTLASFNPITEEEI